MWPEAPGSIHWGWALGYSRSHAYGAALDTADLLVASFIGDGEAETKPPAAPWQSISSTARNKLQNRRVEELPSC